MDNQLPIYNLEGVDFIVDVEKAELRESGNKENVIKFSDMRYEKDGYYFNYDRAARNLPELKRLNNGDVVLAKVPHMSQLDPEKMASKYGKQIDDVKDRPDLEVIIDQNALAVRLSGRQVLVVIQDQEFYFNSHFNILSPKDDFRTPGINLNDLEYLPQIQEGVLQFVLDPRINHISDIDPRKITEVPAHLTVVEIPDLKHLDPVGYSRKTGWDLNEILREVPVKMHHTAKIISWKELGIKELGIDELITQNLKRIKKTNEIEPDGKRTINKGRKKGPGL